MTPLLLLVSLAGPARANGQTTHIWITRHALEHLPDGELKDLLSDPAHEGALIHGAMFPDGGYAVDHPYGEAAHWEPFQSRYADWIGDHHAAPWTDEGAHHVAFLMGLASHGMADQTFDAFYFNWSSIKDADAGWAAGKSFDEASDFIFASVHGAQQVPDRWVPETTLVDLYVDGGLAVDEDTLDRGQGLLETAVALVGYGSQNPEFVQTYKDQFPWGGAHLDDETLPGTPRCEGEWVARYWEELYARLTGAARPRPVLGTWPVDGGMGHARDHTAPEARISFLFPVGMAPGGVTPERFTVVDEDGTEVPFDTWVYYGDDSHVVHLVPQQDWAEDADFTATARAGLPYRNGEQLEADVSFTFSTRPAPVDTGAPPEAVPADPKGCRTPAGAGGLVGVLLALLGLSRRRD